MPAAAEARPRPPSPKLSLLVLLLQLLLPLSRRLAASLLVSDERRRRECFRERGSSCDHGKKKKKRKKTLNAIKLLPCSAPLVNSASMHAAAERGAARLLPGGDGGEGETCGERSTGGEGAATAVSWRGGRMRRPSSVASAASGFLMPPSLSPWSRCLSLCA